MARVQATNSPSRNPLPALPLDDESWAKVALLLNLSPKQTRIAELIVRGLSDDEILATLCMSHSTLRTHLSRIFHRLEVGNRVEVILHVFAAAWSLRK